jgi:hypothetical protein
MTPPFLFHEGGSDDFEASFDGFSMAGKIVITRVRQPDSAESP